MLYIVLLFALFAAINPLFSKKHYKLYLTLIVVGLSALAFFVVPSSVMDLYRYNNVMDLYREVGWHWVLKNDMSSNPLASVFFFAVSCLGDNRFLPMITVFVTYSFSLALLYKAGKRYGATRAEMNLALLFFMLNFNYFYVLDVIRIYMCFAVMAYFLYVDIVERKHRWLCWIVYIALCYVHYAMLVFVVVRVLFIFVRRLKGVYAAIPLISLPPVLYIGYKVLLRFNSETAMGILSTASDKAQGYLSYEVFGIWQFLASMIRLFVCMALCLLAIWIYSELQKIIKYSKSGIKVYNNYNILQMERANAFSVLCLYIILTAFTFSFNYQFILRTPYFIQILMSAVLLFVLVQLRTTNRNYYMLMYILVGTESLGHFCYLLVYVYNNAVFQLP
ncbi:MAG: hypothetical protein ACI4K9_06340 [Candidatus Fimenecus sp.]